MTTLDRNNREWFDDHIEAFLDGDLKPEDANRFDDIALMDEDLQRELKVARSISTSLGSMPDMDCPDEVVKAVMSHVRRDVRGSFVADMKSRLQNLASFQLKPALAVALLVIVVVSSSLIGRRGPTTDPEVTQALADVKMALAYLSNAGRTTGTTVRQDVVPLVVGPVSRSMNELIEN